MTGQIDGLKNELSRYVENITFDNYKEAQAHELA